MVVGPILLCTTYNNILLQNKIQTSYYYILLLIIKKSSLLPPLLIRRVERRTTLTSAALLPSPREGATTACQGKKDTFLTEHCASTKRITKARAAHEHAAATDTALYCVGAHAWYRLQQDTQKHTLVRD